MFLECVVVNVKVITMNNFFSQKYVWYHIHRVKLTVFYLLMNFNAIVFGIFTMMYK